MKMYNKPEIEITEIETVDVIATSGEGEESTPYRTLKTAVNGKEGTDYGSQEVSVFER